MHIPPPPSAPRHAWPGPEKLAFNATAQLQLGLRHTILAQQLANVLVFEGEAHIEAFRARLKAAGGDRTVPK